MSHEEHWTNSSVDISNAETGSGSVFVINSSTQSPVTSLPDVVTAGQALPASIYQQQVITYNTDMTSNNTSTIVQSTSQPESVSANCNSQPQSPLRQAPHATSESTPVSPQHQMGQPKGQIGFTIDFDDTGVSWNLKSDLNQFLPSSTKLKMEERRIAAKEQATPKKNQKPSDQPDSKEHEDNSSHNEGSSTLAGADKDDLLSEAGTYIIDHKAAVAKKQEDDGGYKGDYVDLENHEFSVGQSLLMESFLDHAAASCTVSPSLPTCEDTQVKNLLNVNENRTPIVSDCEEEPKAIENHDDCETPKCDNIDNDEENRFATFSRSPKKEAPKVQSMNANFSAIPRAANPVDLTAYRINNVTIDTSQRDSVVISDLSPSPQYCPSVTSSSLVSSKLSPVPARSTSAAKPPAPVAKEPKREPLPKVDNAPRPNITKRPSSANARPTRSTSKIDVDKRLVEMEELLKKNLKVSVGKNVLAQYSTDNDLSKGDDDNVSGPAKIGPARGNFNRLQPIRKSAGPRFAGGKPSDVKSVSSSSDVFEDPKKSTAKLGRVTAVPKQGPPPSPTSIKMNKAMKLRMKKHSDMDDGNDCISMTSDGTSARSLSNSKQLSFARANPMYKSLPVKRGATTPQSVGARGVSIAAARGLTRPAILPNKAAIGGKANMQGNAKQGVTTLRRGENISNTSLTTGGSGNRTPDETNLSTFDKLVLSSIDQLSKKLNLSSSQLVTLCQKNDSLLLSGPGNDQTLGKRMGVKGTGDSSSTDIPKLKTGCQEISAILYELRVVEKNIEHATRHLNAALAFYSSASSSAQKSSSLDNSGNFDDSLVEYF